VILRQDFSEVIHLNRPVSHGLGLAGSGDSSPYVFPDEVLHAENGSAREHRLEHILSLFGFAIGVEAEGGMILAERFIQCLLLVPAGCGTVDVMIGRGICKVELRRSMNGSQIKLNPRIRNLLRWVLRG
jgi:hypothetical protein